MAGAKKKESNQGKGQQYPSLSAQKRGGSFRAHRPMAGYSDMRGGAVANGLLVMWIQRNSTFLVHGFMIPIMKCANWASLA